MEISKTEIGNALTSADENHVLATANDIYDETQQAYQSDINKSLTEGKQDKLVSGSNIKTINGTSVLGAGNITIEGGGSIDTSGNYPNMTVGKANKLATARTISLSGGAEGTATAFDGSKDVSIPVKKVNSNVVTWSQDAKMSTPPITAIAKISNNNVLAFFKPSALSVEYSTDNGSSWLDYGLTDVEKTHLTTPMVGGHNIYLGKQGGNTNLSANNRLRITFDFIEGEIRASIKQLLIRFQNGPSSTSYYYIKMSYELYQNYKTDTWIGTGDVRVTTNGFVTFPTNNFHSYSDPTFGFPYPGATYPARMRVEFFRTVADTYNLYIANFIAVADDVSSAPNNMAKMSLPCSLDWQQNATFPANIKGKKLVTDGGTNQEVLLGDGSLRPISELSPITDADADILLDNHIHSIDIKASGDDVNINIIESTKNGNAWETTKKSLPVPVATQETAGVISAADKQKIDAIDYEDNTLFVGDGTNGTLSVGYESSKASAEMRVLRDRLATIHTTSYNDTTGGSIAVMESNGGKGTVEVNGDQCAELVLSGAGQVRATLTKKNEDGTAVKTVIDAEEGITAPKLATIGGTSEQILLGDGTLITFDELKAKLGLI
jgi:hypothetical protein